MDAMQQSVPLSLAPVGVRLTLAAVESAPAAPTGRRAREAAPNARRLAQLGLRPGADLIVVMRTSGDGRVVAVAGSRIALDRLTAAGLRVVIPDLATDAPGDAGAPAVTLAG